MLPALFAASSVPTITPDVTVTELAVAQPPRMPVASLVRGAVPPQLAAVVQFGSGLPPPVQVTVAADAGRTNPADVAAAAARRMKRFRRMPAMCVMFGLANKTCPLGICPPAAAGEI